MFRKMPLILFAMIVAISLLDNFLSVEIKSLCYALSLTLKSFIVFLLPFIIFGLLFKTALQLAHHATKVILFILLAVCCSNFLSTFLSHYVGIWVHHFDFTMTLPTATQALTPLWTLSLPTWIPNDKAMLAGIVSGLLISYFKPQVGNRLAHFFEQGVNKILSIFTYIIPIFVAGFIVKLNYDGGVKIILQQYAMIFLLIFLSQFAYIAFIYFMSNQCRFSALINSFKNMLPAAIAGFSTMSSAAAMPLTLIGTQKNTQDSAIARATIPFTVNIHLIGDCFAIPILAYAILKNYGVAEPVFLDYIIFSLYFVLAKFSVAAVPGGGIIVMLPILESYLGFNAEMLSLITALYILFDPVITSANVLGNGGFAMVMHKLQKGFAKNVEPIYEKI